MIYLNKLLFIFLFTLLYTTCNSQNDTLKKQEWDVLDGRENTLNPANLEAYNNIRKIILKGKVVDAEKDSVIDNTSLLFKSKYSTSPAITNTEGLFSFEGIDSVAYIILWKKEGFYTDSTLLKKGWIHEYSENELVLKIEKNLGIRLLLCIRDATTKLPIENVKCSLIEQPSFKEYKRGLTDKRGQFKKTIDVSKMGKAYFYALRLEKTGYKPEFIKLKGLFKKGDNQLNLKLVPLVAKSKKK